MTQSGFTPANEQTPLVSKEEEPPVVVRALGGISIAMLFIAVSASMILFNKTLMREDRFPFPVFLVSMHMAGSLTMSLLLRMIAPSFFPSAPIVFREQILPGGGAASGKCLDPITSTLSSLMPFMKISVCFATCLVTGNWAYKVASVSFLQMVKESHIVFIYALSLVFGLEQLRPRSVVVLFFVAVCATLAVSAQASLSLAGLILQMVAGFFGSLQIVLTNVMLARTGQGRIDPMTMVLCTAPLTLAVLLPANFFLWNDEILARLAQYPSLIVGNVLLAFLVQVTSAVTIRSLSATGMSLASVAKDLGIVLAASRILGEQLSGLQVVGFMGSVSFIGLYSAMKLFPRAFESGAASASECVESLQGPRDSK